MMTVLKKKGRIVRRHDDTTDLPFDVQPYYVHHYE